MRINSLLAILILVSGCRGFVQTADIGDNANDQIQSGESDVGERRIPESPIIITDREELSKYVGRVVTLRGKQSRSKLPYVLGVRVRGNYAFSDKVVEVTGRLSSYEVTQEDVDAFDEAQRKQLFAAPRPSVGTHYSINDPVTGKTPRTRLWIVDIVDDAE